MRDGKELLESMAKIAEYLEHDIETCGMCFHRHVMSEVAREMLEKNEFEEAASKWDTEVKRRWEEGKFFKLWQEEKKAGRDPHPAFESRGWEP